MKKEKQKNGELTREEKILLEEYKAAQDSAQHHDTLVWTVTSIFWAANIILVGTVLTAINQYKLKCLPFVLSFLGICLCLSVCAFTGQFNYIMRQKYIRCKKIEGELGMKQHRKLKYLRGQKKIYKFIMNIFIAIWVGIILYVISDPLVSIIFSLHLD
ncbi:MAG: hypothetical protein NT166_02835 [Candidatus Aminicenantes bacterium]|nr:hypothetical protein [Candidatus Aminicenantes bacterium]